MCSGQLSFLPLAGREMSSSYGYGMKPSVANWDDGVSAGCTMGPLAWTMDGHIMC